MTGDSPDQAVMVYTTFPDADAADRAAARLVEERLVACANILPAMRSVYRWQGKVERADEAVMILKSTAAAVTALTDRILALHPYDVPAIVVLPIVGGEASYLAWIAEETVAPA